MKKLRQMPVRTHRLGAVALELAGALLVITGLYQVYPPAALVFAGVTLVFIAQGLERRQ